MPGPPLPRGVAGDTFFEGDPNFQRPARVFAWLAAEPGIGVITGEPGVGKTAAMRHLCRSLPRHEHRIVYLGDTIVKPLDLYPEFLTTGRSGPWWLPRRGQVGGPVVRRVGSSDGQRSKSRFA